MTFTPFELKSYGVTTVGERGQIVIPNEIRKKLNLKKGDKFLVFSKDEAVIAMIKSDKFDSITDQILKDVKNIKLIKKKNNK